MTNDNNSFNVLTHDRPKFSTYDILDIGSLPDVDWTMTSAIDDAQYLNPFNGGMVSKPTFYYYRFYFFIQRIKQVLFFIEMYVVKLVNSYDF